ncbi:sigma-70 family RNA polymerase sigma factor, partial [bacterium]|nr:sigma-70 family RNA polymerase sigma factor [bacterium]
MPGHEKNQEFAEIVDAHYEMIFRGALSMTRNKHLAEEIVQDTFVSAFRKFDSFSGRSSVSTWLYRIMLNNYSKYARRKKLLSRLGFVRGDGNLSQTRSVPSADSSPATEVANSEESELLRKAVDELPAKLRVV